MKNYFKNRILIVTYQKRNNYNNKINNLEERIILLPLSIFNKTQKKKFKKVIK